MLLRSLVHHAHTPVVYISDEHSRKIADGIAWKVDHPSDLLDADIIFFDDNGKGNVADSFRERGKFVWCGGAIADRLELDRLFGMNTCLEYGVPIPDTYEVSGLTDVKTVLKSEFNPADPVVVKLDDSSRCSMSYVAKDAKDLVTQVEHWESDGQINEPWTGILQRFVKGIEVSIEGWWTGERWVFPNLTIEEKKCWPGDLGPAVGCAANIVASISPNSKLFKRMVEPFGPFLKKHNYTGQLDINMIVSDEGPCALEFTPRPGYDATPTLAYSRHGGYGGMILTALDPEPHDSGVRADGPWKEDPYAAGLRVTIPPYPFESKSEKLSVDALATCEGVPIDVDEEELEHFYLYDAMVTERGLVCAGTVGAIGIALGHGNSPRAAGRAAYKVAEKLRIPNKQYRAIDAFDRAEKDIDTLIADGLVKIT